MENEKLTKEDLINFIFVLSEVQAELWRYHPLNPESVYVIAEYEKVTNKIEDLKKQIDELEKD